MNLFKSMGPLKYVVIGLFAVLIVLGVVKIKGTVGGKNAKAAAEAEKLASVTAEDVIENLVKTDLPPMGKITLTCNYEGVPFAMETSTYTMDNVTYMSGRSAVDPTGNAFNESASQYIEQIGNITTFYTMNPHSEEYDGTWIKETLAATKDKQGYKSLGYMMQDLEKPEIVEETKDPSYTTYVITGTLPGDKFSKYFYNIFGSLGIRCKVSFVVDKEFGYITGVQIESDEETDYLADLLFIENFTMPTKEEQQASIAVPDDVRVGDAEEGCLLYYIQDEVHNTVKVTED